MLTRAALVPVLAGVVATTVAAPAVADDDPVIVSPNTRGWIDTTVEEAGQAAKPARKPAEAARTCTQTKPDDAVGYASEAQFASGAPAGEGPGGWVVRRCSDGTVDIAWVPVPTGSPAAAAAQLAQRATSRLPLPLPEPRFEPRRQSSAGATTLVAIPTWFYLDGWAPVTQRTSAGGVWAEVTATPVATTWSPGDGNPAVRCTGPGRAWSSTQTSAAPCRYTYRRSSAAQPDNVYLAQVTVVWRITWRGSGGLGGSLPLMERQSTFPVAVAERQTVIIQGGGR